MRVVKVQTPLQTCHLGCGMGEAVDHNMELVGCGRVLSVVNANDRSFGEVSRVVQRAWFGLQRAKGNADGPHPEGQLRFGQCVLGGAVICFKH